MLKLEEGVTKTLGTIDIQIDENDDPSGFVNRAGLKFPVIKIANTVLSSADIIDFSLSIGSDKLPRLIFGFNDFDKGFQTSDLLEPDSELLIFIGSTVSEEKPIKLKFSIYDVQGLGGTFRIEGLLHVDDTLITVPNGSINDVLRSICNESKLGLISSIDDTLFINTNLRNMSTIDCLNFIGDYMNKSWFIDQWYNIVFFDIDASIKAHKESFVSVNYIDGEQLPENSKVMFSNDVNQNVFLGLLGYEPDYTFKNPVQYEFDEVLYDKSFEPDFSLNQVAECELPLSILNYDLVGLTVTTDYSPYMNAGQTIDIEVWTKPNIPKRVPDSEFRTANENKNTKSEMIYEYSGTFICVRSEYTWSGMDMIKQSSLVVKIID